MRVRDWPIERKFRIGTLLVALPAIALISFYLIEAEEQSVRQSRLASAQALAGVIAQSSAAAVIYRDEADAMQILSGVAAEPTVEAAALYDANGVLFAFFPTNLPPSELPSRVERGRIDFTLSRLELFTDIMNNNRHAGSAYVRIDLTDVQARVREYITTVLTIALVATLLALLVSKILERWITKPILLLSETASEIASQGNYAIRAPKLGEDEVGQLVDSFNRMIEETQRSQERVKESAATLERRVEERTAELKESNDQLEAFVYSIAHDLRAPLRAMQAFSQMLVEDYGPKLDEGGRTYVMRIDKSAEFMDRMIMDLLAFGRAAKAEIELGPVNVKQAWDTAVYQCASQIEQARARIEAIAPFPPVCAHEATLSQVLANLLSNALKFVPAGTEPNVKFRAEDRHGTVRLWIEDNGVGIPPEHQQRIFRVFERLNGSRFPGTGIGLSIVRKGVERMGGIVGVESHPGKGSKFFVELPSAPGAAPG